MVPSFQFTYTLRTSALISSLSDTFMIGSLTLFGPISSLFSTHNQNLTISAPLNLPLLHLNQTSTLGNPAFHQEVIFFPASVLNGLCTGITLVISYVRCFEAALKIGAPDDTKTYLAISGKGYSQVIR